MSTAYAVIGANYGDEGKGLMVDYLARTKGQAWFTRVVRFNGGAQAGHTVQLPTGERHVFHHFGSGTLAGAGTVLSQFFICNPALYCAERTLLGRRTSVSHTNVSAHRACPITTPFDMIVNQARERSMGRDRHGSCGVGIYDTVNRQRSVDFRLTVGDLEASLDGFIIKARQIRQLYAQLNPEFADELWRFDNDQFNRWVTDCETFRTTVQPYSTLRAYDTENIIFEGAQGLALDQNNLSDFPHLTPSNTGMENVSILAKQMGISTVRAVYVTRTYLTRHGEGPLPHGMPMPAEYSDPTNVPNEFQGSLRFAPLDEAAVMRRITHDVVKAQLPVEVHVAMTCADHIEPPEDGLLEPRFISRGPTYKDVEEL